MKLINDYKLVYEKGAGEEAQIYASKNRTPSEGDHVTVPNIGSYPNAKIFYEKDNQLFVGNSRIPSGDDQSFEFTCNGELVLGERPAAVVAHQLGDEGAVEPEILEEPEVEPSEAID